MSEGGKRFSPLSPDEARQFEEASYNDELPFLTRLTARALFLLGLRPITYVHTVPEWIARRGNKLVFDVTPYSEIQTRSDECKKGKGKIGAKNPNGANMHEKGKPCYDCREFGETNGFDGKTKNTPRTFALEAPELRELGEDFEWYFKENEHIPFLQNGVNTRVRKVAEKAGIGESRGYKTLERRGKEFEVIDISAYDLRHTYGTRLARMEYNKYEIKAEMGHGSTKMPERYIEFTGVRKSRVQKEKWDSDVY